MDIRRFFGKKKKFQPEQEDSPKPWQYFDHLRLVENWTVVVGVVWVCNLC